MPRPIAGFRAAYLICCILLGPPRIFGRHVLRRHHTIVQNPVERNHRLPLTHSLRYAESPGLCCASSGLRHRSSLNTEYRAATPDAGPKPCSLSRGTNTAVSSLLNYRHARKVSDLDGPNQERHDLRSNNRWLRSVADRHLSGHEKFFFPRQPKSRVAQL